MLENCAVSCGVCSGPPAVAAEVAAGSGRIAAIAAKTALGGATSQLPIARPAPAASTRAVSLRAAAEPLAGCFRRVRRPDKVTKASAALPVKTCSGQAAKQLIHVLLDRNTS